MEAIALMKKDTAINFMTTPMVKALATKRAAEQRRSLANYLEGLILADQVHEKEAESTPDVTPTVIGTSPCET
jgi:hypothetical protein